MVDPRMHVEGGDLRDLDSPVNVHRLENMSVGYPEPKVRLDDHPVRPTSERNLDLKYLRRCRRVSLNHNMVNSFVNIIVLSWAMKRIACNAADIRNRS